MKRHRTYFILSIGLGLFLLSACHKASVNNTPTPSPSPSPAISGKLLFFGGPLTEADVSLNLFKDEQCIKLNYKGDLSPDERNQLNECAKRDVVKVRPDENGNYRVVPPSPGWWQVKVLWWSDKTLGGTSGFKDVGDFQVIYAEKKDEPGKVRFFASTKPFHTTGQEDVVKNFSISK